MAEKIGKIVVAVLFGIFPAIPFYGSLLQEQSQVTRYLMGSTPLLIGLIISITMFGLVMIIFHYHEKFMNPTR